MVAVRLGGILARGLQRFDTLHGFETPRLFDFGARSAIYDPSQTHARIFVAVDQAPSLHEVNTHVCVLFVASAEVRGDMSEGLAAVPNHAWI